MTAPAPPWDVLTDKFFSFSSSIVSLLFSKPPNRIDLIVMGVSEASRDYILGFAIETSPMAQSEPFLDRVHVPRE